MTIDIIGTTAILDSEIVLVILTSLQLQKNQVLDKMHREIAMLIMMVI